MKPDVDEDEANAEVHKWYEIQEELKESQVKIWQYGGAGDSDND